MAITTTTTGFSQYTPRRLSRTVFNGFQGTGIDVFTDPSDQSPKNFQDLTNVMPTITGSFVRRWGMNQRGTALSQEQGYKRMFTYAAKADVTDAGTVDTFLILGTDDNFTDILYSELGGSFPYPVPEFGNVGPVYGLTSRGYFYESNGVAAPQKQNFSQRSVDTRWNWGIATPLGISVAGSQQLFLDNLTGLIAGTGTNYSGSPTVSFSGGGGTGAAATAFVVSGIITHFTVTAGGATYTSPPTVTVTDGTGTGAQYMVAVVDLDSTSGTFGQVTAVILQGPITLNSGRRYAIAYQNSITGHTSDFIYSYYLVKPDNPIPSIGDTASASFNNIQTGVDKIAVTFVNHDNVSVDPQVDTVIIMAAADGGDVTTLYELTTVDSGTFHGSFPTDSYTYIDTIPDTINDQFEGSYTGPTLLASNIWAEPDGIGGSIGIFANTPPPNIINKPVLHKGRMFATDGRSIFFSKSLSEVTTSTGLITSKWEEAWPGFNQLDIAYGNETINGLLSDGTVLYIGTSDNIYRLLGSSAADFAIPDTIFRGVGVQAQEAWTVVYKDDVPAGYMWITPDGKIMLSDFNTYEEVGKYIYPLIPSLGTPTQIQSVSYGPYSVAVISVQATNNQPTYLVYDTKNGGWYIWKRTNWNPGDHTKPNYALLSYTDALGISYIYTNVTEDHSGAMNSYLQYFDPAQLTDVALGASNPAGTITWSTQTSWLPFDDATSFKVLNELEGWSQDAAIVATVTAAFDDTFTPTVVKTGALVNGPIGTRKLYLAGTKTNARYFTIGFSTSDYTSLATTNPILRQFSVEHFPQTRL